MKKYRILGGTTTLKYYSKVFFANSKDEAEEAAMEDFHDIFYEEEMDWEVDDIKVLDDFEIVEINEI